MCSELDKVVCRLCMRQGMVLSIVFCDTFSYVFIDRMNLRNDNIVKKKLLHPVLPFFRSHPRTHCLSHVHSHMGRRHAPLASACHWPVAGLTPCAVALKQGAGNHRTPVLISLCSLPKTTVHSTRHLFPFHHRHGKPLNTRRRIPKGGQSC